MKDKRKTLVLGTAQWGWTTSKADAFLLLEQWLNAGFRSIDCATNYPINRQAEDFRAAEKILLEFVQAHQLRDLDIIMKLGSLNNMRGPEINLSASFIQMAGEEYHRLFGSNLGVLMFHWDNREDTTEIENSLQALKQICEQQSIRPGLSGIKHPALYARLNESLQLHFDIQLKHNPIYSDLPRYAPYFPPEAHNFYAYGTTAGGIKFPNQSYQQNSSFIVRGGDVAANQEKLLQLQQKALSISPELKAMWQVGMVFAAWNPNIRGLISGAKTKEQLEQSISLWSDMQEGAYQNLYEIL